VILADGKRAGTSVRYSCGFNLELWQAGHKFTKKSSKIVPLGAPNNGDLNNTGK